MTGIFKSRKLAFLAFLGVAIVAVFAFFLISINMGGHMAGPTYIAPGNVGLVIDNYQGVIETGKMPAGLHWQGPWETVIEVPTAQRTITLDHTQQEPDGSPGGVLVNTASNMLSADVTAQYSIEGDRANDLYSAYQDQFADIDAFERIHLIPAIKESVNYAIGDIDTADALTSAGKERAAATALDMLQKEWGPRGVDFHNLFVRGIDLDQESKDLLNQTVQKLQEIDNARLAVQQQQIDNQTVIQQARAAAQINRLQDSTLTDLYLQDKLLDRVDTVYLPSDQILGMLRESGGGNAAATSSGGVSGTTRRTRR
jgi:regulator of protease activity HflC (stomatin/prohibitin superfamily)